MTAPESRLHATDERGGALVASDVRYARVDGCDLVLDVYAPRNGGPHPALLVIHGGGFRNGDKSQWREEGLRLAAAGFVALVANYRLAPPGGRWHAPAPIEDVRLAARWVREHAATFGASPARLGAFGSSAGGNLALLLATTGQPGLDRVEVAVAWSAPTALRHLASPPLILLARLLGPSLFRRLAPRATASVINYMGCSLDGWPERWDAASPAFQVTAQTAPIFLANSRQELMPLGQALVMAERLAMAGVPHTLRVLEGARHGRGYAAQVWDESVAFLADHLR